MDSITTILSSSRMELLIVAASILLSWLGLYFMLGYLHRFEGQYLPFLFEKIYALMIPLLIIISCILFMFLKLKKYSLLVYMTGIVFIFLVFFLTSFITGIVLKVKRAKSIIIFLNIAGILVGAYSFVYDGVSFAGVKRNAAAVRLPNIVVITVDALRQDHVSCYNKGNASTPVIDSIAEDGIIFENARSAAPWTIPSFSSFVTSLYPSSLGQLNGKGDIKVPTSLETFPEVLKKNGYTNYIFSFPFVQRKSIGIAQGIDYLVEVPYYSWYENEFRQITLIKGLIPENFLWEAKYVNASVMKFADKLKEPFFIWIHYKDTHSPFTLAEIQEDPLMKTTRYPSNFLDVRTGDFHVNHAGKLKFKKFYALEAEYVDKKIGELLSIFQAKGYLRNAFIMVSADHGEEFWEHNNIGHGHSLYEEVIRIPLIIKFPDKIKRPHKIKANVSLIDVAPTFLKYIGIHQPYKYQGIDLQEILYDPEKYSHRPLFEENLLFYNEAKAVIRGYDKLIIQDDGFQLYDLLNDPGELSPIRDYNKAKELLFLIAQWQKENEAFRVSHSISVSSENSYGDELKEMLKSLGYVQ